MMHSDVSPGWMRRENPLLGAIAAGTLHKGCVLTGAAALLLFAIRGAAALVWPRSHDRADSPQ